MFWASLKVGTMTERMGDTAGAGAVPRGALGNGVTDIRSNLEQRPEDSPNRVGEQGAILRAASLVNAQGLWPLYVRCVVRDPLESEFPAP
jgi:hypothetical protein